jgi:hypothetical protein
MAFSHKVLLVGLIGCFLTVSAAGGESKRPEKSSVPGAASEGVSEIDFEYAPSSVLCARHRIVLRADDGAEAFTERCRNAAREDRATFCEVKEGRLSPGTFAKLGQLLETSSFFSMQSEYWRDVSDAVFESTRAKRDGKKHEVINYADAGPLNLWTIQRAIEGAIFNAEWQRSTKRSKCPRWNDPHKKRP